MTTTVPILIVGGGGAGLTASMILSTLDVPSLLVSGLPTTSILPEAHVLGQRTMEIYSEVGVAEAIYEKGTPAENLVATGFYAGLAGTHPNAGREIGKLETWGAGDRDPEYIDASPCRTANLPQIRLEPILKAHAEKLNPGGIRFNHELIALEQDDTGVRSTILDKVTGEEYEVFSQYVIAADGGRTVGKMVGIELEGDQNILEAVSVHMTADLSDWLHDDSVLGSVARRRARGVGRAGALRRQRNRRDGGHPPHALDARVLLERHEFRQVHDGLLRQVPRRLASR